MEQTGRTDRENTERQSVRLDSVDVQRAPGFETGGVSLDDLSPGVNVVCGGNAAGKTTLSKAIRWSLWPDSDDVPDQARIRTDLTYDDEDRAVVIRSGVTNHLRDGGEASPIPVRSLTDGERYTLSLEEMLQPSSDGGAFADAILRESTGGFDVDAVREDLGLDGGVSPSTRNLGATKAAEEAVEEVERRRREAPDLSAERETLAEVEAELAAADDARDRAELLELTISFAEAREEFREADERVDEFPEELAEFDGDEAEELERIKQEIARHEAAVWEAATTDRDAAAEIAETGLDESIDGQELEKLRNHRAELASLEADRDRLERELTKAKEERAETRNKIPLDLGVGTLRDVDTDELDDLRGFLTAVTVAQRTRQIQSEINDAFDTVDLQPERDREVLVTGRDALAAWLSEPVPEEVEEPDESENEDTNLRRVAAGAGLLVAAGGVAIGLSGNLLGFLLTLVGVAQAVYAWTAGGDGEDADDSEQTTPEPRATHRQQFDKTGLEPPREWTHEAVTDRLSELHEALADAEAAETAVETRDRLRAQFDEPEARDRAEEIHDRLRETLGVDAESSLDPDELELGVTVERIERWQEADETVAAKYDELQAAARQSERRLSKIRDLIEPYETAVHEYTVENAADAASVIDDLEARSKQYEAARERRDDVVGEVATAKVDLSEARKEYEALFTERNLAVGEEDKLREHAEQYESYRDAVEERRSADDLLEQRRDDLADHDDYDADEGLEEHDEDELEEKLETVREQAERYEDLLEQKNELENEIEAAKESTDVEDAVAARDEALADLEARLEADAGAAVADELLDAVADETGAESQEPVFRRADELLREITNGAFELRLEDGTFRAYDTREDSRVDLDDLSTGTRVQVLLSVRVAFVEHREGDTAPPLLFDDTLAVFDDLRAEEVLETLIEFAREGRQVFYFTARGDELARLREQLGESEVPHTVHHLDGVYDDTPTSRAPAVDADWTTNEIPEPEDDDHDAYRERLDVPTFDPRQGAKTAHLWYVTENPAVLHDLLSARVDRWGQLKSMLENGSGDGLLSPDDRERLRRNGAALEAFTEEYTVGRGDPVGRKELEESGAVSSNFIDEVSELAESVDGDPEAVLDGIDDDVNRFRSSKLEQLREYLRGEGYLDPQPTRSDKEIRMAVVDAYAGAGLSGGEADAAAQRLLERVSDPTESTE